MNITTCIARHISEVFEGNNWTEVDIKQTLSDVTWEEATTITAASVNTIAALLFHLDFYNGVIMSRLNGINPVIDEHNGMNVPPIENERQWKQLQQKAFDSTARLAAVVEDFPEERLQELTQRGLHTYYKTLHGIAEHSHYHLGQMVLLKNLVRNMPKAG